MNTQHLPDPETGSPRPVRRGAAFIGLLWGGVLAAALAGVGLVTWVTRESEVAAVRRQLTHCLGSSGEQSFAIRLGAVPFALARMAARWVDLPVEAQAGIRAVRGVEVSISERPRGAEPAAGRGVLSAADGVLTRRGWDRLVGVIEGNTVVGVYVPTSIRSPRDIRVCVLVLDGEQLVVASLRGDLEPLLELEPVREALNRARHAAAAPILAASATVGSRH